ncbi:MAG: FAD-dependent oxidoreductase [Hyphomonadaceae bacterium]|jgi:monoamine oxidase/SAM-dependent methyltransferase|nr:FAD-dependent oxidoreductase [Hyphomonadaceae bacterium]MCZ8195949.1 FAD-dependent oxidoreductase [Aquidulcibacter sp.]
MIRIAVIGGGPGGLMTCDALREKVGQLVCVTLFEASDRLGGKIVSRQFTSAPVLYEAGVAEIYGYTTLGHDPLHNMIQSFGLETTVMDSDALHLDGKIIHGIEGMRAVYGEATADEILRFRALCSKMMTPEAYYEGIGKIDNDHPWAFKKANQIMERFVKDATARRFIRTMARSDIATEEHITNGLNALKNYLMDVEGYIDVYSINGGNESLIRGLSDRCEAAIRLNERVVKVTPSNTGFEIQSVRGVEHLSANFDIVICSLPHNWLATMAWGEEALSQIMTRHIAHFDRPAHYLRLAVLFERPFWDQTLMGSWLMSEAFGGCCIYIEGSRHDSKGFGVLNWLICGADALAFANVDDQTLLQTALSTLPRDFGDVSDLVIEANVHRWLSSVNAIPGGLPVRGVLENHCPASKNYPNLVVTGDYLFDSTLNGLLDSVDAATDIVQARVMALRYLSATAQESGNRGRAVGRPLPKPSARIDRSYFDHYRGIGPFQSCWDRFAPPDLIAALIRQAWSIEGTQPIRLLVAGSASGELVQAMRERGIDAHGLENNRYIYGKTQPACQPYNHFGSLTDMPFDDASFDIVYESCLCHVSPRSIPTAISEIARVSRRGLFFGSVTADTGTEVCDTYELLRGVKKLATWWEWSELLFDEDFELLVHDSQLLANMWETVLKAGLGSEIRFPDSESLRYCFYKRGGS